MAPTLRSGHKAKCTKSPAPSAPKKVGRPKLHRLRTCRFCHRKLKTPQGLLKHLAKKNKGDKKSVTARAEARKLARRLASKTYYIRKKDGITLEQWRLHMPLTRLLRARQAAEHRANS